MSRVNGRQYRFGVSICVVLLSVAGCNQRAQSRFVSGSGNNESAERLAEYIVLTSDALGETDNQRMISAVSTPAVVSNCPSAVELVVMKYLNRGIAPTSVGSGGDTALHRACLNGYSGAAQALLDAGADVNAANDVGETPLMLAVSGGSANVIELLIVSGADCTRRNADGDMALDIASRSNNRQSKTIIALLSECTLNRKGGSDQ